MVAWNWGNEKVVIKANPAWFEFNIERVIATIVNHWGSRSARNSVRTIHITPNMKDSLSMNFTCNED